MRTGRLLLATTAALLCVWHTALAQDEPSVTVSGSATVTGDFYSFTTNDSTQLPRRPNSLLRFILNPTITIGDYITLPFNIMLSSQETNVVTPNAKNSSFLQFLLNPMNNVGFISFAPRIGWLQTYIGTHVPMYSELSAGDEQLFGLGVDLTPGNLRFAASAGISQRAIEPDSVNSVRGAYARHLYMTKIGYGSEESWLLHINIVRAKDDPASLQTRPPDITPQEGLLLSTNFRMGFSEKVYLTGEAGTSAFTRDQYADDVELASPIPAGIFRQRISTRTDYAGTLALFWNEDDWGVKLSGKYIGAGYSSLGYPYLQPDRMDFLVAPRVRIFDRKVSINGSIGHRTNNLSETKSAKTTQIIGSANVLAVLSDALSVTGRYANFGIRNNVLNDTLKVETISNSVTLAPTLTLRSETVMHTVTASYSIDAFNDYNVISGREASNNTQTMMLMYLVSLQELPLTVNAMGSRMTNNLPSSLLTLYTGSLGLSTSLLEGKLAPSLSVSFTSNRLGDFTPDNQFTVRLGAQWNISDWLVLNTAGSVNDYRYGSSKPGATFRETMLETSLSTRF